MEINEKKTITIPANEAYGEVREDLILQITKEELPDNLEPEPGMGLVAKSADGTERQLRVAEVKEDHIVVDANHPLAGHDLVFDLEVVAIQ
jgi:FKBP-type peptidyl-prolyl cis-trans isomerase 2